jgi:hypothetical protein
MVNSRSTRRIKSEVAVRRGQEDKELARNSHRNRPALDGSPLLWLFGGSVQVQYELGGLLKSDNLAHLSLNTLIQNGGTRLQAIVGTMPEMFPDGAGSHRGRTLHLDASSARCSIMGVPGRLHSLSIAEPI